jgi:gliding motility-associated-like protein
MRNFLNPSIAKSLISKSGAKEQNAFVKYCLMVLMILGMISGVSAQITNLNFSNEAISYSEISGGTNIVPGGSALGAVSALTPIGFDFQFQGNTYGNISVNAAGLLKFGAVVVTNESANNASSIINTPKLYAWWDATYTVAAANGGGVSTLLTGSAPNRVLTVQWKVSYAANAATGFSYQIKLYETSNKIEFLYGSAPGSPQSASVGLGNYGANEYLSIYTFNHIPSSKQNYNANTIFPGVGNGMKYTFTPANFSATCPDCFSSKPSFWLKADGAINATRTLKNVPAASRTSSSDWASSWPASASVLSATNGWIPGASEGGAANPTGSNAIGSITLDLGSVQTIDGVATLGAGSAAYYVQDYYVRVSNDNLTWTNIGLFEGNELNTALHYSDFAAPVSCRYVRVIPSAFTTYRAMRLDVYTKTTATPANNDKVAIWEDASGNEEDAFQNNVAAQPTYNTNQINFNPAINFSNSVNTAMNLPDMANIRQTYWVAQDLTAAGGTYYHVLFGNGTAPYYHGGATGQLQFSSSMTAAQVTWKKEGAAATMATAYDFGPQGKPNLITSTALIAANPLSAISLSYQAGLTRSWNGPIAEIISFQNAHNAAQQNQVESYLAIKYGLTINHDYFAGNGTTVWNKTANATYHNNVFGIGRSDCQGLHQRQAFSTNYNVKFITLGNNSIIGATNASSVGNDIATDNAFVVLGDNNGNLLYSETLVGNYYPLNRKWKVSNVGMTVATKISVPAFGNSAINALPNSAYQQYESETVYLVVDTDGDGNFANATYMAMTKVGTGATATWEISQVLPHNAVIGFAVKQNLLDTDTDGVLDVTDLDDDNDGILDKQEQISCISLGVNLESVSFSGVSVTEKTKNTIRTNTNGWNSSYSTENFTLPLSLKFNKTTTEGSAMIGFIPAGSTTQTPANYNDNGYKFYTAATQLYGYFGATWSFNHGAITGTEEYSIDISATGYVTVKVNGVQKQAFQGVNSAYKLVVSGSTTSSLFSNIRLTNTNYPEKSICLDRDSDNDGIPNRLDLDSDGDGCSDAYEAGTTTSFSANYSHSAPFGTNGFANTLEATADNGIYNGTYNALYVIDNKTKACLDSDGDNINDLTDLDDDNDGVVDDEECNSPTFSSWTDEASFKSKIMSSAFHGTLFRSKSGKYYVAGQYAKADGTDQVIPTLVTPANGYNYTGEIIDMAAAGSNSCYVLATTEGIWVWGYLNTNFVLPGTTNTGASPFQKVALPAEIDPKNIKSISASSNNFLILLLDGTVFSYSKGIAALNGAGLTSATTGFTKVLVAPNTPLVNIDQVEATSNGSIAADITHSKLYTWGTNVYLGNGSAATTLNYATEMTNPLPSGTGIAMIDATYNASMTYLVLGTNKKVYAMGSGSEGILGLNSLSNTTTWANVLGKDGVGILENVEYLSAQNSTDLYTSASVILNTGQPLSWGSVGGSAMIGFSANTLVPKTPDGIAPTDIIYVLENGGHLTPMLNDKGEIGNVGHNVSGAFGDGSTTNRAAYVFNPFERGSDLSDNIAASCNPDIDGDGIINRLDLDTDGDGCSDAKESSVSGTLISGNLVNIANGSTTTTSVTNAIAQGTYGTNGLADGVETSANSGNINYLSTYNAYAQSANLNLCADFDNDGVPDIMDIDDENDGVLDAIESPNCYFTAATFESGNRKAILAVSSEIPRVSPNNIGINLVDGDGTTNAINFVNTSTIVNKELVKVAFNYPVPLTQLVVRLANTYSVFNAASTVVVQGSLDNTSWTDLSAPLTFNTAADNTIIAPFWTAATFNEVFPITQNQARYKYYRIYGTAGTLNNNGVATELYFKTATSYEPSFYTKSDCSAMDTDGDTIPNHLDPDSDNDGCNDAIESGAYPVGTSVPVAGTTAANYGANGFVNAKETGSESGVFNGTYTYNRALTNYINGCTDTDGDGVANINDLDDDNDGVLDETECPIVTCSPTNIITNGGFESLTGGFYTNANYPGWKTTATDNQIEIWNGGTPPAAEGLRFAELNAYQKSSLYNKLCIAPGSVFKWSIKHRGRSGVDVADVQFGATVAGAVTVQTMSDGTTAWGTYQGTYTVPAGQTETYFVIKSISSTGGDAWGNFIDDFKIEMVALANEVTSTCDTDGDGIPNTLDPDSDNDGCNDAIESGAYSVGTSVPVAGTTAANYGANGFVNAKETATESGVYVGTYTYHFAIDTTMYACQDSDSDGITDLIDIDDDNDGVTDVKEFSCNSTTSFTNGTCTTAQFGTAQYGIFTHCSGWNAYDFDPSAAVDRSDFDYMGLSNGEPYFDLQGSYTNPIFGKIYKTFTTIPGVTYQFDVTLISSFVDATNGSKPYVKAINNANGSVLGTVYLNGTGVRTLTFIATSTSTMITFGHDSRVSFTGNQFWKGGTLLQNGEVYQECAIQDTDNDGIPNQLDLDSDADGCSDAKEAGTTTSTTANFAHPAPFGTNGLADGLETTADNGVFNGSYTYNYATSNTVNACIDTDNDGIADLIDIDDDNDGVLDNVECAPVQLNTNESNGTFGTAAAPRNLANTTVTGGYTYFASNTGASQYAVVNQSTPYHPAANFWRYVGHTSGTATDAYLAVNGNMTVGNFYSENVTLQAGAKYRISFWHQAASAANDYQLAADVLSSSNVVLASANSGPQNSLGWKLTTIDFTSASNQTVSFIIKNVSTNSSGNDFSIDDISILQISCPDADGDGISNSLDSDSDNDGCSDANEAYNNTSAQGTDNNQYYGTGNPPAVNANGTVTAASYTGTYTNATVAGTSSTITTESTNQTVQVGDNATFTAVVTPGSGVTSYQWEQSTDGGATWANVTNNATYAGATTTTLVVSNVTMAMHQYKYRLQIKESNFACGNQTTSAARLIISNVPSIVDDTKAVAEDTPATGNVLTNDNGSGNSALTVNSFTINGTTYTAGQTATIPNVGTVVVNADGSYTFTPVANFNGAVPPIEYTATDANGGTDTGKLDITVTPVNDVPVVANETTSTPQDTPKLGNVLTNDTDADGNTLSVTTFTIGGVTFNAGDTATIPGKGTIVVNADGSYTFTPAFGYVGPVPAIDYTVSDGNGGNATGTLAITVGNLNDTPLPSDDVVTTPAGSTKTGNVLTNDTDVDGDTLTVTKITIAGVDYPVGTPVVLTEGTITVNADGSYTFVPATGYSGDVPDIIYTVTDGTTIDTAKLDLFVSPVNAAPVATDDTTTVAEDGTATGNLLTNDTDADAGTTLVITEYSFTVGGVTYTYPAGSRSVIPGVGTIQVNANGTFEFIPNADYTGAVPAIDYTISDGHGGTDVGRLAITMVPVNDTPNAVNDDNIATPEDTPATGNVLDNDSDIDGDALSVKEFTVGGVTYPAGTTAQIPGKGSVVINADGTFVFTPEPNYSGQVPTIVYTTEDSTGATDSANLNLSVTPVNDAPVTINDTKTVGQGETASGNVLTNDSDPENNPLTVTSFTVNGQTYPAGSIVDIPNVGTLKLNADGSYTFVPVTGFSGQVPTITYTVSDGQGATNTSTLTINTTEDLDDDNDGILDSVENAACNPADPNCDTDGDGIPNRLDIDSDNDGINDVIEAGGTDADNDGRADGAVDANGVPQSANGGLTTVDTDGDGKANPYDVDSDADGISDAIEKGANGNNPVDTDGDAIPDYLDVDSDGDGISDAIEKGPGTSPVDTDGDGTPDYLDLDSDNDGIPDAVEKGSGATPVDTDGDGTPDFRDLDSDADGILDSVEKGTNGATPRDTDGDTIPDYIDVDSDGDGISDAIEKGTGTTPVDTDNDGTPDYLDLDSDNDGIPDAVEKGTGATPVDTDGDGTPDYRDTDSDADGILDSIEKGLNGATPVDTDGDTIPDFQDLDSDGDGIPDTIEKGTGVLPRDSDGDGTPDYLDLDSDNDGIPDAIEDAVCTGTAPCTPTDTDGDGIPDYRDVDSDADGITDAIEKGTGTTPVDTDNDGTPDYQDLDSDNDGISDAIEKGTGATPRDTDGDGIPDYLDLDSDNDGIPDSVEKGTGTTPLDTDGDGIPDYRDTDSDNDGILDSVEKGTGTTPVDTDNDGTPDYQDLDSDNDGISDAIEKGTGTTPVDTDNDGTPDYQDLDSDNDGISDAIEKGTGTTPLDTDGDGIPDYRDTDSDNDGILDSVEKGTGATPVDTDGDGTPDFQDLDSDNDGIPDAIEKGTGTTPLDTDGDGIPDYRDTDSDNDGILDSVEKGTGATPVDTDGDGTPDYRDLDSDNDGILDSVEKGTGTTPIDTDGDGTPDFQDLDSDNDGIPDSVEKGTGTTPLDTDGDGIPDYRDTDSDNDGILDSVEKGTGATPVDTDGDGTPDYRDLDSDNDGKLDAQEGTVDTDGDGTPNYQDLDSDGDGVLDAEDQCPLVVGTPAAFGCPADFDGDGLDDVDDLDDDNDGILDSVEAAACTPVDPNCDTDGDGIPNRLDSDSDNDGISDVKEAGGIDTDFDGRVDGGVDADGVPLSTNGGLTPPNTDGDGQANPYDVDSDGDGIPDAIEKGPNGNTPVDTDGDNIPDYLDLDSDGDGIPDAIERGPIGTTPLDTDGDGTPDYRDTDSDNDGIPDTVEKGPNGVTPLDTDGDGTPDYRDTDSDNDGIPDTVEKGPNGATPVDTDNDGTPDYRDLDSDNDGIIDAIEKGPGATPVDTDGDTIPDFQDLDSDGDGISDAIEKGPGATPIDTDGDGIPDYRDLDSDNDGIPDAIEKGTGATPVDTDGDGIPDYRDLDSDNDGILDAVEKGPGATPVDTDGDNIPDFQDLDSDGDGIPDSQEGVVDTDGDGTPNYLDLDSDGDGTLDANDQCPLVVGTIAMNGCPADFDGDGLDDVVDLDDDNDGILDSVENAVCTPVDPNCDTDGDGIPNRYDADSDNDGIKDTKEAGVVDANNDGVADGGVDANGVPLSTNGGITPPNTDGDGQPNPYDLDSDGDGIPDAIEKGANGANPVDTDGDGTPDYLDLDSDNDGIPDAVEKGTGASILDTDGDGIPDYRDLDSDNDGITDAVEKGPNGATPLDTDNDGTPDYRDLDSDNDGILDSIEKGPGATPVDTDGDGTPDYRDVDSDNDGILDSIEKGPGATPVDTDGDGTPDYRDVDSDNDGITDAIEKGPGATPVDTDGDGTPDFRDLDSDADGIPDAIEKGPGAAPVDTDGDGTPDFQDVDSDNDGIPDAVEKGIDPLHPVDTDGDGIPDYQDVDSDNDGIPDSVEKGPNGTTPLDTDGDGIPDYRDLDSDNDGITDAIEKGANGATPVDTDGDGTPDYRDLDSDADNKPDNQEGLTDTDSDGTPNYRDTDSDNDGVLDVNDQCPYVEGTALLNGCPPDSDGDGLTDDIDLDDDNDGILDSVDNGICNPASNNCDTDGDGIPNRLDPDSDNDGISDVRESNGNDANGDGMVDGPVDTNGVPQSSNGGVTPPNTDGDANPNPYDLDSDGDGIPDAIEKGANGNAPVDTDGDGTPDYLDLDSDNDGIPDAVERGSGTSILDTDGDGTPDYRDLDSDNDGIPDAVEKGPNGAIPVDTDGDGTPDFRDLDSDNDGILDAVEKGPNGATPVDTDGDSIPDYRDLDSDGDGVRDFEDDCSLTVGIPLLNGCPGIDSDGDGIPDAVDLDDDNDGITDVVENAACSPSTPNCDTDGDGIINSLDLDSDNDGITDARESNGVDVNGDGIIDGSVDTNGVPVAANGGTTPPDTDGDGKRNPYDVDSDGDGIPDSVEKGANPNAPVDTDGDGTPDYLDLDSDNDGIPDTVEKGANGATPVDTDGDGTPDYLDLDSDNDGILDAIEKGPNGATPLDTDGDGTPDYRDLDSDNDGISDAIEKGSNGATPVDTDGDGTPDFRDLDSENDGIPDAIEKGTGSTTQDTDGDGIPNYLDKDSDNDGILDSVENAACNPAVALCDTDGDGTPNYMDLDSDGDGIKDVVEGAANGVVLDANNDGIVDGAINANGVPQNANSGNGLTPPNTDGTAGTDPYDTDADGDGILDSVEKGTGTILIDTDGDGIPNYRDVDSDGDGVTDAQEIIDGTNPIDPCSFKVGSQTLPISGSWNNADCDGDGLTNGEEKIGIDNPSTPDNPNGKITDPLNKDTDGDGVTDGQEALDGTNPNDPCNSNPTHIILPQSASFLAGDCDGDGLSNGQEIGLDASKPNDSDKDGVYDYLEVNLHQDTPAEIEIYNSVSPNGDDVNDVFVIRGIENYPNNTVSIYNRWGVKVFELDGYGQTDKMFRGVSEGRVTIKQGDELPEGTYFYILRYLNTVGAEKQRSGYLYIKR